MPIRAMLGQTAFDSHQATEIAAAFESVLAELRLVDRSDPVTTLIAKVIIDGAKAGEVDGAKLHDCAIAAVTKH